MSFITDKGLILKKRNFQENDRIFLIYTEKEGKLEILGRGTRKKQSKLAGKLEPFSLSEITYVRGKGFDNVTAVKTIESYRHVFENPLAFYWLNFLLEIIDIHIKTRQKDNDIFRLLSELIKFIDRENSEDKSIVLIQAAVFKLISYLGFQPELYNCQICQKKIIPNNNYFSFCNGGLICKGCFAKDKESVSISEEEIKLVRFFLENNLEEIRKIKAHENYMKKITKIILMYVPYVLDKELKSTRFIKNKTV